MNTSWIGFDDSSLLCMHEAPTCLGQYWLRVTSLGENSPVSHHVQDLTQHCSLTKHACKAPVQLITYKAAQASQPPLPDLLDP